MKESPFPHGILCILVAVIDHFASGWLYSDQTRLVMGYSVLKDPEQVIHFGLPPLCLNYLVLAFNVDPLEWMCAHYVSRLCFQSAKSVMCDIHETGQK